MRGLWMVLLVVLTTLTTVPAYPETLSAPTRIQSVAVLEDNNLLRLEVLISNPPSNPASCANDVLVDIRLDSPDRSETAQRELLNLVNLAFVTRRFVRLYFLDQDDPDNCSTAGTSSSIRVAVGVQVIY